MKKIVWMLTGIVMLLNCSYAKTFTDVGNNHWAKGIINEWTNNGIMSGYTDGTFRPSNSVTKAELVTILNKINNDEEIITKRPSKDISLSDWYCVDMGVALKNGLVELDGNGNLNPKAYVTREDAITMIAKLFNLKYTGNPLSVLSKFSDSNKIEDKNLPYVAAMVKEGYVGGNNGKINPDKNITRAELVSLLDSTIEVIYTSGRVSNKEINGNLVINGEKVTLSSVEVHGYIFVLKGAKDGQIEFNNVYASKGINSNSNTVISYNDGTKLHDNLSNKEEEKHADEVQFVNIVYSETEWTNKNVTATLKFDGDAMEIINNKGKNKYKFKENGEFTFVCVDANGFEHRYTAKVANIAKKDIDIEVNVKDNVNHAIVTVNVIKNEAPIKAMYYIDGIKNIEDTLGAGTLIENNQFKITETSDYTVAAIDEAGNTVKKDFFWKNTSKYTVDVKQNKGGIITPEEPDEILYRGSQTFNIVADTENGYDLIGIKIDGELDENIEIINNKQATYTFSNVTENHSIEAIFKLREYELDIIQVPNGKITPEIILAEHGKNVKLDFIPNRGYEITKVIIDGNEVEFNKTGDGTTYEVKNVTESHTITAEFTKKKYTILVQKPDLLTGKITYDNMGNDVVGGNEPNKNIAEIQIEHGESLTLYILEEPGFKIIDVVVDNLSAGAMSVYTFREVESSHSFVAMFGNTDALETTKVGPYAYAAISDRNGEYVCDIYGFGEVYDFDIGAQPLGFYTDLIKKVTVRTGINNVGAGLFAGCISLEEIYLPTTVTNIGANAFRDCENLNKIEMPHEMEVIGEGTFYNCKSLTTVSVPENVKVIEKDAFNNCTNLETITILGELQEIGDRAFKDCTSLIQLEIPQTVTKIGEEVLFGCKELQAIEIPKSVEFIGKAAFNDCSKLKVINFKNRKDITSLGREWFPNGGDYREYVNRDTYVVQRESFEITVITPEHGTITPGTMNVKRSATQKFTIEPDVGYKLKELIVDGEKETLTLEYEFKPVLSTHTITATFEPIVYEITYDLSGGMLAVLNPAQYTVLDVITLTNPIRYGYEFAGWEGTELSEPTRNVKIENETENRHYTARWIPANYNILYGNVEGATNLNPSTYTIEDSIILASPTKPGYSFAGWTENGQTITQITPGSMGNRLFVASWQPIKYTITYVLNGGIYDGKVEEYTIEDVVIINEPTRVGYKFIGWRGTDLDNSEGVYNTSVTISNMIGDRTYSAIWTPESYIITYKLGYEGKSESDTYTVVDTYKNLRTPLRAGYTFLGWREVYANGSESVDYISRISGSEMRNVTYKAYWQPIEYTITYMLYDAVVQEQKYTVENGEITLRTDFIRPGYKFLGWKEIDLLGNESAEYVTGFSANVLSNKKFAAQWELLP